MTTTSLTPWIEWEDWQAGLYAIDYQPDHVTSSARLLADPDQFEATATEMIRCWPHAATQNLAHMWTGRNAWVGQASCLYAHGAPGAATREAWGQLTATQQRVANHTATIVRTQWERTLNGCQTLFGS